MPKLELLQFRDGLKHVTPIKNKIPFYSSVFGEQFPGNKLDVEYWWSLLREPVRFFDAVQAACLDGHKLFLECGPQPVLTSYMKDSLADITGVTQVTHTFEKNDIPEANPVSRSLCRAIASGARVDKSKIWGKGQGTFAELPLYQWQNVEFRIDDTEVIQDKMGVSDMSHPMLGRRLGSEANCWVNQFDANLQQDLAQHVINQSAIVPGSAMLEMAVAAARRTLDKDQVEIRELDILAPLLLMDNSTSDVRIQTDSKSSFLTISSRVALSEDKWLDHISCRYGNFGNDDVSGYAAPVVEYQAGDVSGEVAYEIATDMGFHYGPNFRKLSHLRHNDQNQIEVVLSEPNVSAAGLSFDPFTMDALFHGLLVGLESQKQLSKEFAYVPIYLDSLRVWGEECVFKTARISVVKVGAKSIVVNIDCFDISGQLAAQLQGLRFSAMRFGKPFGLANSAYGYELVTIPDFQKLSPFAHTISTEEVSRSFVEALSANDRIINDESHLLIEAICLRIAYDTVAWIADSDLQIKDKFSLSCNMEFLDLLLGLLELSELAVLSNGVWQLKAETGLPEADFQISSLLAEMPESVLECAVLSRLSSSAREILKSEESVSPNNIFGVEILKAYTTASIKVKHRIQLAIDGLHRFLEQLPDDAESSVAIALPNHSLITKDIFDLTRGKVVRIISFDEIADHENQYDLTVFPLGLPNKVTAGTDASPVVDMLCEGGIFVSLESMGSSLTNMLRAIGNGESQSAQSEIINQKVRFDRAYWVEWLDAAGFRDQEIDDLAAGLSGISLMTAKKLVTEVSRDQSAEAGVSDVEFVDQEDLLSRYNFTEKLQDIKLSFLERKSEDDESNNTLLIYCERSMAGQEQLAERIDVISKKLVSLSGETKDVWFILPGGVFCAEKQTPVPEQTAIWTYARTAQNEFPNLNVRCVDLDDSFGDALSILDEILESDVDETELIVQNGKVQAIRISEGLPHNFAKNDAEKTIDRFMASEYKTNLVMPHSARLDDLHWAATKKEAPAPNELEVEVCATGLNYRDVMWALGMLPEEALESGFAGPSLGIEYAGRISRVGENVRDFQKNDLVAAIGPASFSSHICMMRTRRSCCPIISTSLRRPRFPLHSSRPGIRSFTLPDCGAMKRY